jgi:hypothetical protein
LPACTACERSNRAAECSSTNDEFARGKERSYVATLETRIEKLEKKLAETRGQRRLSLAMMESGTVTPRQPTGPAVDVRKREQRDARRKEASDIDDLVSDFGYL